MADGSHLENLKTSRYLKKHLTDFDETWNADACLPSKLHRPEKNQNLTILDGGWPPF